jgi:hypothetical protein
MLAPSRPPARTHTYMLVLSPNRAARPPERETETFVSGLAAVYTRLQALETDLRQVRFRPDQTLGRSAHIPTRPYPKLLRTGLYRTLPPATSARRTESSGLTAATGSLTSSSAHGNHWTPNFVKRLHGSHWVADFLERSPELLDAGLHRVGSRKLWSPDRVERPHGSYWVADIVERASRNHWTPDFFERAHRNR